MSRFVKIGYLHRIKVGANMIPIVNLVDGERQELFEYVKSNPVVLQEYVSDYLERRPNKYGDKILLINKKRKEQ